MESTLLELLLGKTTTKLFQFGDTKVELRTLTQAEKDDVTSRVFALNIVAQDELIKRPYLGYALTSFNGVAVSAFPEIKRLSESKKDVKVNLIVEEYLGTLNSNLIDLLFDLYRQLEVIEAKRYDEVKKRLADHSEG